MITKELNRVVLNVYVASYIICGPHVEVQTHHLKQKNEKNSVPTFEFRCWVVGKALGLGLYQKKGAQGGSQGYVPYFYEKRKARTWNGMPIVTWR
jgi:hypothetical protein